MYPLDDGGVPRQENSVIFGHKFTIKVTEKGIVIFTKIPHDLLDIQEYSLHSPILSKTWEKYRGGHKESSCPDHAYRTYGTAVKNAVWTGSRVALKEFYTADSEVSCRKPRCMQSATGCHRNPHCNRISRLQLERAQLMVIKHQLTHHFHRKKQKV